MNRILVPVAAVFTILAGCVSCQKDGRLESVNDVLSEIDIAQAPDNVLRYYVDLTFKRPCSYRIEYWESGNPSVRSSTREFESDGKTGRTPIMFIKPSTDYSFDVTVVCEGKSFSTDKGYQFSTKALPLGVPVYTLVENYEYETAIPGYILHGQASSPTGYLTFTDTDGNVVWYQDFDEAVRHFCFDRPSRSLVVLTGFKNSLSDVETQRFCNKYVRIDLEGNILEEWKTSPSTIDFPHHDIKVDPEGNLVILHGVPVKYDLSPIGGGSSVSVCGDGFTVLSSAGEKLFTWDTSCELDPVKDAYLNVLESYYDLVHANSVSWDSEGNYYMTLNNLNELWKIDGKSGKVLYRVGDHGNVALPENGYTSGIHSSVPLAPDKVLVFDNGSDSKISRALVYDIDPSSKSAKVALSVSIPSEFSSTDRSNCELLEDQGMIFFGSTAGRCCLFTDMEGNIIKLIKRTGISYRTHYFPTIEY